MLILKKGISPLIAAVLLIAATMSIAGILSWYVTQLVRRDDTEAPSPIQNGFESNFTGTMANYTTRSLFEWILICNDTIVFRGNNTEVMDVFYSGNYTVLSCPECREDWQIYCSYLGTEKREINETEPSSSIEQKCIKINGLDAVQQTFQYEWRDVHDYPQDIVIVCEEGWECVQLIEDSPWRSCQKLEEVTTTTIESDRICIPGRPATYCDILTTKEGKNYTYNCFTYAVMTWECFNRSEVTIQEDVRM